VETTQLVEQLNWLNANYMKLINSYGGRWLSLDDQSTVRVGQSLSSVSLSGQQTIIVRLPTVSEVKQTIQIASI